MNVGDRQPLGLLKITVIAAAILALVATLLLVVNSSSVDRFRFASSSDENGAVGETCVESLQSKIDEAGPGATVRLDEDCIYRESVVVDKPLTLSGAGEIRGSDVWSGWAREDESSWVSERSVPNDLSLSSRYRCEGESRRCLMPEQVFLDGEPLRQVARDPRSGQFALDGRRRVVLSEDPADRTVEVTVRKDWLTGASDNVRVQGITMKHAAGDGLWNGGYSGWTVENCDLSYAHAANLKLTLGSSLVARDNDLHDGGQMGLASNDARIEITGNRLYRNNTEGFDPVWEAGGMKISQPFTALISENEVYDNDSIGIWTDTVNERQASVEISRNRVHHNPRQGIRVEITKNFSVNDNVVWENGWGEGDSYEGTGITVAGSRSGVVNDNVLAWNASGIAVVQQDRKRPNEQSYDTVSDVRLNRNQIVQNELPDSTQHAAVVWNDDARAIEEGAPSIYDPVARNGGTDNRYWFGASEGETNRFKWSSRLQSLDAFNETRAEQNGEYLSDSEKDSLLRTYDLPEDPEGRKPGAGGITAQMFRMLERWIAKFLGEGS